MNRTVKTLNRLLALHSRSLPTYLANAQPYTGPGDERAIETLSHIVDDHRLMVDRIAAVIREEEGTVNVGVYPMEFTDLHDLSMDFILRRVIERQKREIAEIDSCSSQLAGHPRAQAVAREALGAAQGHLESLEELLSTAAG